MTSIQLGPLALPLAPLLVLLVWWMTSYLAGRFLPDETNRSRARDHVGYATLAGLLVARIAQVALHWEAYQPEPLSALDIRDGGFEVGFGVAGAVLWMAWVLWRQASWRVPVGGVAVAGLAVWLGIRLWLAPPEIPLPPLSFATLSTATQASRTVTLTELAGGRPMIINLWAHWCAPCRAEMPAFAEANRSIPDVTFVFVNQGDREADAQRFLRTLPTPLNHVLLDPNWTLAAAAGSRSLPTTLFVDARGVIVKRHVGMLNVPALRVEASSLNRR
jgi:thiol-disulfide isomerase/thioredoxin